MTDLASINPAPTNPQIVAFGADHRGYALKESVKQQMMDSGFTAFDCGTDNNTDRVDAMDYALSVVRAIKEGRAGLGILVCGSGAAMCITANRFPFIRAAVCSSVEEAETARAHNDINILCLSADSVDHALAPEIAKAFLAGEPLGDRYALRRARLADLNIEEL